MYQWVGIKKETQTADHDMFIRADNSQIAIGGG